MALCRAHDYFNIAILPSVSALAINAMLVPSEESVAAHSAVVSFFAVYLVVDACALAAWPHIAASPKMLVGHHICALFLLHQMSRTAEGPFLVSASVLIEFNTALLMIRRRVSRSALLEFLFYASWIGCRILIGGWVVFQAAVDQTRPVRRVAPPAAFVGVCFMFALQLKWTFDLLLKRKGDRR